MMKHIVRVTFVLALAAAARTAPAAESPSSYGRSSGPLSNTSIVHRVRAANGRIEMTVNESRILTLDKKIPQFQVNNPDILTLTALSPTQVQIHAKQPGVTQVNLWDEQNRIYSLDVIVFGDARELAMLLESEFPNCSLQIKPISNGVLISGYVDQPEHVSNIIAIAEQYYPKVLSNMTVGGVHQVLLHVKAMEVSRTKLRTLGIDWHLFAGDAIITSAVSGMLSDVTRGVTEVPGGETWGYERQLGNTPTFSFSILDGPDAFFGVLEALREDNLMKVLAEPTLVTVSGRPAYFQVGGEFPIIVPQSLGTVSIEYKKYGVQVDFVPIVLGNGRIRLEVRPRVSEIDNTRSVVLNSAVIPGLRVREVDTGVEMMAGQTLAIAGLVQTRVEANKRGLPWVSDLPYIGTLFRRVEHRNNEVELLILVTPELVEAMDAHQVPPCGPGMRTASPDDIELYFKGHLEVPNCCPPGWEGMRQVSMVTGGQTAEGPVIEQPSQQPGDVQGAEQTPAGRPPQSVSPPPEGPPESPPPRLESAQPPPSSSARPGPPSASTAGTLAQAEPEAVSQRAEEDAPNKLPGLIGPLGYEPLRP